MTLRRRLLGVVLASITLLLMATGVPAATIPVSVLMPASFADASAPLVREFNASHPHIASRSPEGRSTPNPCRIWRSAACYWAAAHTTCC